MSGCSCIICERLGRASKLVVNRSWQWRIDEEINEDYEDSSSCGRKHYPTHPGSCDATFVRLQQLKDSVAVILPPHKHAAVAPAPIKEVAELKNTQYHDPDRVQNCHEFSNPTKED